MREIVKDFIEATITDFEAENYEAMFDAWYYHFFNTRRNIDTENLDELFRIFNTVEIDLYELSHDARKNLIAEKMFHYIDSTLNNDATKRKIQLPEVINALNSKLGLSLIELNNLFKYTANHIKMYHDIVISSFTIERKDS